MHIHISSYLVKKKHVTTRVRVNPIIEFVFSLRPGANFLDLERPTDKISAAQMSALVVTGFFFTRYGVNPTRS